MASSTTRDWQLSKSVLESNRYMLKKQLHCDVAFTFFGGEEVILAHKYMLVSRSPVFCSMLTDPGKHKNNQIAIEDVDKETFMQMLRFMYFEETDLTEENVLMILFCAKKYMVVGLEQLCRQFLAEHLNNANVCYLLDQARLLEDIQLQEKCLKIIDIQAMEAFQSSSFTQIGRKSLEKIIERDTLELDEIEVYEACLRWAEAECRKQMIKMRLDSPELICPSHCWTVRLLQRFTLLHNNNTWDINGVRAHPKLESKHAWSVMSVCLFASLCYDLMGVPPFTVSDQNKRKCLGNAIYLVRFPIMDPNEFIRTVSSSEVLSSDEAFNLTLFIKGSAPRMSLSFLAKERCGLWKTEFFKNLRFTRQVAFSWPGALAGQTQIPFQISYCKLSTVVVKSVIFLNSTDCLFNKVTLRSSEGKVNRYEDRTYLGYHLYEVCFHPPVRLLSGDSASVVVNYSGSLSPTSLLVGPGVIGDPTKVPSGAFRFQSESPPDEFASGDVTISMKCREWYFLVGFKFKVK